jgi:hypothetical protein
MVGTGPRAHWVSGVGFNASSLCARPHVLGCGCGHACEYECTAMAGQAAATSSMLRTLPLTSCHAVCLAVLPGPSGRPATAASPAASTSHGGALASTAAERTQPPSPLQPKQPPPPQQQPEAAAMPASCGDAQPAAASTSSKAAVLANDEALPWDLPADTSPPKKAAQRQQRPQGSGKSAAAGAPFVQATGGLRALQHP